MKHDIIIVGGGASGIMAAITAKDLGKDVAILERNDRIGKKLLTTGNGRCNITNRCIDYSRYHSNNDGFFNFALNNFDYRNSELFFNSIGLHLTLLDEGKMYPMSLQASSVLDTIRLALEERGIPVYLNNKVKDIKIKNSEFHISTDDKEESFQCNKLILATGGKAAPKTGSDGIGYFIAKSFGHMIINPIPALVQLKLKYKNLKALSGIKFNGYCEVLVKGEVKRREFGEILFTDYGISGPPILQLSSIAAKALQQGKNADIRIDMMPQYKMKELIDFLENHWGIFSYRTVFNSLIGIINKKMIPIILKEAELDNMHKLCLELSWKEKKNIYNFLKNWTFQVIDTNSFSNAQVTAGGVDTKYVETETMKSKIIDNLYFCGEILDVDGDCGGFNLQWAWSSGYIAGKSAADT
ncbi:NAD(P)/FAD-dependent oxidoreductase [Clostridium pasteurianum]|uniref:Flavoprotein, HI0933 family n=1 Tax=Clostridium pasteurianum BC1 TaxID=86416 RepID=R4KIR8_CLOPA|nr:NAD(P)/FAD-dependent oxidoreductase [Clostridium pasteurianum]AGK99510.1 flavoprotein, HI0933 family [Clostridium pasteurianum BC1]